MATKTATLVKPKRLVDADDTRVTPAEAKMIRRGMKQIKEGRFSMKPSSPQAVWTLKPPLQLQRRLAELRPDGVCAIRVSHRAARRRGTDWILPRYLLRCGDCDRSLEIYYDEEALEINGVHGSIGNWREILLPLLRPRRAK